MQKQVDIYLVGPIGAGKSQIVTLLAALSMPVELVRVYSIQADVADLRIRSMRDSLSAQLEMELK